MNIITAVFYMLLVFAVSVVPTPEGVDPFPGFDKVVHFLIYGLMGVLWTRVFVRGRAGWPRFGAVFPRVLAITFFYGLFIEVVQGMTPASETSLYDALANGAGGAAGVCLYYCVLRLCRTKEGP
jgi:VanZ family protein